MNAKKIDAQLHRSIGLGAEVIDDPSVLPLHVLRVYDAILDDSFTILARFESEIQAERPDPKCGDTCQGSPCPKPAHNDRYYRMDWEKILARARINEGEHAAVQKTRKWAEETYNKARKLSRLLQKENTWDDFYYKHFFEKLLEDNMPQNWHSSREARMRFYYDSFEIAKDSCWTVFHKDHDCYKAPKPDLIAHFKIHDEKDESPASAPDRWQWDSRPNPSIAKAFSRSTLLHLQKHGLLPSVFNRFAKDKKGTKPEHAEYVLGYPWLVAEYKLAQENGKGQCYIQVANAARCALHMYSNLARYCRGDDATPMEYNPWIPPVITMTGVENVVRIWIAYCQHEFREDDPDCERVQVQCIWKGDMRFLEDVLKLQSIIDNTHTWAMRDVRGTISAHLDHWLVRFPLDVIPTAELRKKNKKEAQAGTPRTPQSVRKRSENFYPDLSQLVEDRAMDLVSRALDSLWPRSPETKPLEGIQTTKSDTASDVRSSWMVDSCNESPSINRNGCVADSHLESSPLAAKSTFQLSQRNLNHQTRSPRYIGSFPESDSDSEDEHPSHDAKEVKAAGRNDESTFLSPSPPARASRSRASSTPRSPLRRSPRNKQERPEHHL